MAGLTQASPLPSWELGVAGGWLGLLPPGGRLGGRFCRPRGGPGAHWT